MRGLYHADMRALLDILFPPRESELVVRTLTLDVLAERLQPTQSEYCEDTTTLFSYRDPIVESLIVEAKFNNNKQAQKLMGSVVHDYVTDWLHELQAYETRSVVLVPVPLSTERLRKRGYNQVERILAHTTLTLPVSKLLKRRRNTRAQTSLSKTERLTNMENTFCASHTLDPATLYLLVDDVLTTGATMRAAAKAMKDGGAERIYGLAFAH